MGLGPNSGSLLDRTGTPEIVWRDPFAMALEQRDRAEQRLAKAIWYAQRHKKPAKPLAPVTALPKLKGQDRLWQWTGEALPSKGMIEHGYYTAEQLRAAGFKLPPLPKKEKKK